MAGLGKNMLDLRLSNRIAILGLIYAGGAMSRKDIAARLNLTPGAITVITGDLIDEGVLLETKAVEGSNRLGRREVLLDVNRKALKVMCAFFGSRETRVTCVNFAGDIDYITSLFFDPDEKAENILNATADAFLACMDEMPLRERRWVVGAGLGLKGIYDTERGVSVHSFGLWEDEVPVRSMMEERLGLRVLADNDVNCVINAEMMFQPERVAGSMVLVRYGPLIGSALVINDENYYGRRYRSMEIGHTVVDPAGAECRCGKRGCLETRIGFDVIARQLEIHYSPTATPALYGLTAGDRSKISMKLIMESYDRNEPVVCRVVEGAMDHLALAIVNMVSLLDPERIILYGMPFESEKYLSALKEKAARLMGGRTPDMERSRRNLYLEDIGCASIVIKGFLNSGAKFVNPAVNYFTNGE